jgi:hypothetical protein
LVEVLGRVVARLVLAPVLARAPEVVLDRPAVEGRLVVGAWLVVAGRLPVLL